MFAGSPFVPANTFWTPIVTPNILFPRVARPIAGDRKLVSTSAFRNSRICANSQLITGGQVVAGSNPVSPTLFMQVKCHV